LHTFSLVTRDKPGVLVRIALVFSRRGFNIESLAVSPGRIEGFARMTIVSRGAPESVEQIHKQIAKLIDVVFVSDDRGETPIEAEIALLKLRVSSQAEKLALLDRLKRQRVRVADESDGHFIAVIDGTSEELDELIDTLPANLLEELTRTGKIVMDRGASHYAHLLDPQR
jgi:acetolactate synthase-1/3 small subunit